MTRSVGAVRRAGSLAGVFVVALGFVAGCGNSNGVASWPGRLDSPGRVVEFYGRPVEPSEIKVLCSSADGGGVSLRISGPDGLSAAASQKADGSQVSDLVVTGDRGSEVIARGAQWVSLNGETGFQLVPSGDYFETFYLHDGAAFCGARPS